MLKSLINKRFLRLVKNNLLATLFWKAKIVRVHLDAAPGRNRDVCDGLVQIDPKEG